MDSGEQVLFRGALAALDRINELFKDRRAGLDACHRMLRLLLERKRRFVLYLGAGASTQVTADSPPGSEDYLGRDWTAFLQALLEKLPPNERNEFFTSLGQRVGAAPCNQISDLFKHLDKLNIAWYLSRRFTSKNERDKKIREVVEPAKGAERSSPLLDQLAKLPFRDIVTTNYDSNIKYFFGRGENTLPEITCTKDLFRSLDGNETPRLFYLHGKAEGPEAGLVLDRFDYAQLLAERDGILDYVTFLLRNSHVLYIGFGLDDPSFNLVETRLNSSPDAKDRPESFALLSNTTEDERRAWQSRKLNIVDYGDHTILAELFKCMNEVREFVWYAEPDRPQNADPQQPRIGKYIQKAAQHYVDGEFRKSISNYRAALGSTVFWERNEKLDYRSPDRAECVCNILIQLAQCHYKLRWNLRSERGEEDHSTRMQHNLNNAQEITDCIKTKSTVSGNQRALLALQSSVNVLKARIKYHEGDFPIARDLYTDIITQTESDAQLGGAIDLWKLKIAEAYYYSQCQISRIDYQVRPAPCGWKDEQIRVLREVGTKTEALCLEIANSSGGFRTEEERNHYLKSFATILRIAKWTEGRLTISIFGDLLPTQAERSKQDCTTLTSGIELLQTDPWKVTCNSHEVLKDKRDWDAPSRWLAMKYRYEGRAHVLQWLMTTGQSTDDLLKAFTCIQNAMRQTAGRDLQRQSMLNVLEAARLSILVMFGERVMRGRRVADGIKSAPFSWGAALCYLDNAFNMIDTLETPLNDQWHRVLAYRLASYFGLLAVPIQYDKLSGMNNETLHKFLSQSTDQMREQVLSLYRQFSNTSHEGVMQERIDRYEQTFASIQKEIEAVAAKGTT